MSPQRCLALLGALGAISQGVEVRVETSFGQLVGEHALLSGCDSWMGIPYAEPPLGDLRFAPPEPWQQPYPSEGRVATEAGAFCVQAVSDKLPQPGAEDCLSLNVWRPTGAQPTAGLAVMVFIHGGAFVEGASVQSLVPNGPNMYDGCKLASSQQVVFVSLNYRLGPFGFGSFQGDDGQLHTNFGTQDQREALRWVRNQVQSFGGDPEKVTLFGESAGGISVMHHAVSPLSRGLFRAGISESGFPMASKPVDAINSTTFVAGRLGCEGETDQMACLRGKGAEELLVASLGLWWGPVLDGVELPEHPVALFDQGKSHIAALMAGTNTDEGTMFVWPVYPEGMDENAFRQWVPGILKNSSLVMTPEELQRIFDMYPATGADFRDVAAKIMMDSTFLCGTHFALQSQSRRTDAFAYRFNWLGGCRLLGALEHIPGIFHSIELPYVFGDPMRFACLFDPEFEALSDRMMRMWSDFAKYLDPGYSSSGSFPKYDEGASQNIVFQAPTDTVEEDYRGKFCGLWKDLIISKFIPSGGGGQTIPGVAEILI